MSAAEEFTEFAVGAAPRLRRTAFLLCGDWHTAEDLTQTTLARMFVSWRRISRQDAVYGYASRTLVNAFLADRRRRRGRELLTGWLPERPDPAAVPAPEVRMQADQGRRLPDQRRHHPGRQDGVRHAGLHRGFGHGDADRDRHGDRRGADRRRGPPTAIGIAPDGKTAYVACLGTPRPSGHRGPDLDRYQQGRDADRDPREPPGDGDRGWNAGGGVRRYATGDSRSRAGAAAAGVAQWQSSSLPSWSCGFDSRRPLSTNVVSKSMSRHGAGLRLSDPGISARWWRHRPRGRRARR